MHWPFTACINAKQSRRFWPVEPTSIISRKLGTGLPLWSPRLVTQRSSQKTGEERCVTSLKTAAKETINALRCAKSHE